MKIATILTLTSVILASILFCLVVSLVPAVAQRNNVHIPDRNLRAAIVNSLYNKKSGDTISQEDMRRLTVLRMRKLGIQDLTGLEFATNLKFLRLDSNQISDVSPLAGLTNLKDLNLNSNQISDVSPLAGLTNLEGLRLGGNQISDISPLAGLTNLTSLVLAPNQISDISPLAGLTNLEGLTLAGNQISDISPLIGLTNLETVYLNKNQISDISPLAGLTNLKLLYLDRNQISDFSPIAGLIPKLGSYKNERQTVSKGSSFRIPDSSLGVAIRKSLGKRSGATISQTDMRKLTVLRAYNRSIKNLTGLEYATNLKTLRLASNQISDISPLASLTKLTELHLGSNLISDISPLSGLRNLKWLHLGDNQISDFSPIARLVPKLRVYVNANQTVSKGGSVHIPDSKLRAAIERGLGKRSGATITPLDMRKLTIFRARRQGIKNLTGLEYAINLKKLYFIGNQISDISPLASLTKLTELELSWNQISDISPLSGLRNLKILYLRNNQISDFSPIAGLIPKLRVYVNANQTVSNRDSVHIPDSKLRAAIERELGKRSGATINRTDMSRLTALRAYNRSIKNLTGLEDASNLKTLRLASNQISDISALARLTKLTELELSSNQISDISPLSGLRNLKWLHLGDNQISDFSPLLQLPNLGFLITDDGKFAYRSDVTTYLRNSSFITLSRQKVTTLAYSPDSRTLASASRDGTVRLSNAASGRRKITLKGHVGDVNSVAYSPDGNTLATCGDDHTVRLWHAVTGRHKTTLTGHTGIVSKVAFSPDGKILASASFDGTVRLWDVDTGRHITTLKGHAGRVLDVAFHPDGTLLASASADKTVQLWDGDSTDETWFNITTFKGHTNEVWGVAFSPGRTTLASASFDGTVRLWDPFTKQPSKQHIATLTGHAGEVIDVAYSPDGTLLASGSSDKTVRLWNPGGQHVATLTGHAAHVGSLAFSPNGKHLASAIQGNEVRLYSIDDLRDGFINQSIDTTPGFCLTVDNPRRRIPVPKSLQDEDAPKIAFGYLGGTVNRSFRWTQKDTVYEEKSTDEIVLTVRFRGGGSNQRALVKKHAQAWSDNSGIRFLFPPEIAESGESDIIVGFTEGLGSWSHLGWQCRGIARTGEPTMNLDWSQNYCGGMPATIMHEFGHTLGFQHEHQSPTAELEIDVPKAIQHGTTIFEKQNGDKVKNYEWSLEEYAAALEERLKNYRLLTFNPRYSNFSEFDPKSIMLYSGLPLKNGGLTSCNPKLSATDKLFVGAVYPSVKPYLLAGTISIEGVDDELLGRDELFRKERIPVNIFVQPNNQASEYGFVSLVHFKWGGELRVEVDIGARGVTAGGSIETAVRLRLYEGFSEETNDLDGEEEYFFLVGEESRVRSFKVRNDDLTEGEDWAIVTFSLKIDSSGAAAAPSTETHNLFSASDVNQDGEINAVDLILVSNAIGQSNLTNVRLDVNRDGIVTIADLVQVAQYLGQSTYSSAPAQVVVPVGLTYETVQGWIDDARLADDSSLMFRQGIEKLEYLLTVIIPEKMALLHNYPNPFNPETWVPYHLSEPANVTLTIYGIHGKVVRRLDLGHQAAGYYQSKSRAVYWDGRNNVGERVASGIYFYTITAGDFTATRKMLIMK